MSAILGSTNTRCGPGDRVILMETTLGQGVGGSFSSECLVSSSNLVQEPTVSNEQLIRQLQSFWNWETIGIRSQPERVLSKEDKFALEHFEKHTIFKEGHYQVSLPFLPDYKRPANNYHSVLQMFQNLEKTLIKSKAKHDAYVPAFETFIENQFLELVPKSKEKKSSDVYYLPHFAVFREGHETTAVRVVKNAASTDKDGVSLNASLAQGPLLLHDLLDQLISFRQYAVPFCSDVEKLFLMVGIAPKDRDYLRLLWRSPGSDKPIKTYRMKVLSFGLNCSPFLAQAVVQKHVNKYEYKYPKAVSILRKGLYCDDLLAGASTVDEAIVLRQQIQSIMADASMNMRKWLCSSKHVMDTIPTEFQSKSAELIIKEQLPNLEENIPKTLGVCWNPVSDSFNFINVHTLLYDVPTETMRTLASRTAKLYDPLGLVSPVTVLAKSLMQECYKADLKWDSPLPDYILQPWEEWKSQLLCLQNFSLPRYVFAQNIKTVELHAFSDASERACAAVVYIRVVDQTDHVKTTLIASKTKLAPLKLVTIPRLELLAAELSAKLATKIRRQLPVDHLVCWIDSLSVLQWLNKPSSHWKTYVGNRVASITEMVEPSCYRYCTTSENIADLPSRGLKPAEFLRHSAWTQGPLFLDEPEEFWPMLPAKPLLDKNILEAVEQERKPRETLLSTLDSHFQFLAEIFTVTRPLPSRFRVYAWLKRFIDRTRKRETPTQRYITALEMKHSLQMFLRLIQASCFSNLIAQLQANGVSNDPKTLKLLPKLDDNGLVCVGSRLSQAFHLSYDVRHPVILPKHNKFVEQLILYIHKLHSHPGPETTLFIVRQKYWLIGSRREIKRILHLCACYKLRAKKFQTQMAPLPLERLTPIESFVNVGLDTFGPFTCQIKIQNNFHELKVYGIIFTCLVTRAVHVELVYDMSTLEFLNAFERFISTRGQVNTVICDNQTAFRKASKQLKRLYSTLGLTPGLD
jgi:hypothetical protein